MRKIAATVPLCCKPLSTQSSYKTAIIEVSPSPPWFFLIPGLYIELGREFKKWGRIRLREEFHKRTKWGSQGKSMW
jgi:hypothetical protein